MSDLISRQKAIEALRKMQTYKLFSGDDMLLIDQAGAQTELMLLPPARPERIKAKWLPIGIADAVGGESAMWGDEIAYHACDNCWQQALEKDGEEVLSDFCPHCGADMKGEDNETD